MISHCFLNTISWPSRTQAAPVSHDGLWSPYKNYENNVNKTQLLLIEIALIISLFLFHFYWYETFQRRCLWQPSEGHSHFQLMKM